MLSFKCLKIQSIPNSGLPASAHFSNSSHIGLLPALIHTISVLVALISLPCRKFLSTHFPEQGLICVKTFITLGSSLLCAPVSNM